MVEDRLHRLFQRLRRRGPLAAVVIAAVTILASLSSLSAALGARHPASVSILYAQGACVGVFASPDTRSPLLTQLEGGGDVTALDQSTVAGVAWQHVHFWSGIEGYIQASALGATPPRRAVEGDCQFPGVPDPQPDVLPADHGPWPLSTRATVSVPSTLYARPDARSLPLAGVPVGAAVTVSAWASAGDGAPWYQVSTPVGSGWLWSGDLRLDMPDGATQIVNGKPIWDPVAGKGMWFTNYFPRHSDVTAIAQAAKRAGITHLYAEVAITQYGFYGRNTLDRLLPAAHAAGISVIAAVYPVLRDVSADVRMTAQVAAYITPTGQRADGIVTDVEEVDNSASVYTYGQLVRGLLGPNALLVADVFHPYAQAYYPYAAIAASWNVISPMDYWHSRRNHGYSSDEVRYFVANSVQTIRAAMTAAGASPALPIEELGQTYDMYTGNGTGAYNAPTASEVTADMATARALGCVGVTFFEWQTTTQDEWAAISAFHW